VNVVIASVLMTALNGRIDNGDESSLNLSFVPSFMIPVEWLMAIVGPAGPAGAAGVGAIP
jgi:hypothetical protein